MAEEKIIIVDNSTPAVDKAGELEVRRNAALTKLAEKKSKSSKSLAERKQKAKAVQDGKIAATTVRKFAPFAYALKSKGIRLVPMTPKTAAKIGLKLMEEAFATSTTNGRLLGVKSVGKMKNKKIQVSYGRSFVDRKAATKGRTTGRTGRSRSVNKSLVQRWLTINVPLDANNMDILSWVSSWKKVPQFLKSGSQLFPVRSKETVASRNLPPA